MKELAEQYQAAVDAHQRGRLDEAERGYRATLAADAAHADALHRLGFLSFQKGDAAAAETFLRQAIAQREDPNFVTDLGNLLAALRRGREAEAAYRRALELRPDSAMTRNNFGLLLQSAGRAAEAEAEYRAALGAVPGHLDARLNLAHVLRQTGRLREAESAYRTVVEMSRDHFGAGFGLLTLLQDEGRNLEAEPILRRLLELNPNVTELHVRLGMLLHKTQRLAEAEERYRHALELNPGDAGAHANLGALLEEAERNDEAETTLRRAIELKPDLAEAHYTLAKILHKAKFWADAEAVYRRSLELKPNLFDARVDFGNMLHAMDRLEEAESIYRSVLSQSPDHTESHFALSWMLLRMGRFDEAWPHFEYRPNRLGGTDAPALPSWPEWRDEPLSGKSLVIWNEQGLGDNIQFMRYAPLLKALGLRHLTLLVPPSLKPLLATIRGVDSVVTQPNDVEPHDYWVLAMSLPLRFGTSVETIPGDLPYLSALPARKEYWRKRLGPEGPKVGLVWKGNPKHKNDARRSLPGLGALAPLWNVPGLRFFSLQKGAGEDEAAAPPDGQPLVNLGPELQDFADTAAVLDELDLLICVDTSIAHLAGALDRPCWILLNAEGTDWRWLRNRSDSPWYPGAVRLFRQRMNDDWNVVVGELAAALRTWADRNPQ